MTQLVRSRCPGCKNLLRIPAEWLHQPIRCKHCGLILCAKQGATPAPATAVPPPVPSHRTPPPAKRNAHATPAARGSAPAEAVAPAVPLAGARGADATPLTVAQAPVSSQFSGLRFDEQEAPRSAGRKRQRGGWWKGPVIALAVLIIAGIVTVASWDRIKALLPALPGEQTAARNDGKGADSVAEPPAKNPEGETPPAIVQVAPIKDKPKQNDPSIEKDPSKIPLRNNPPRKDPSKVDPRRRTNNAFPRRALVISVHDYLYANPIQNGPPGPNAHNFKTFIESLNRGLDIPLTQVAHLSDEAAAKWGGPRAPTKPVIQKTLTSFLDSSRTQDRILIFFVGHSVELGDEVYLTPIEGELDKADTLIPLTWFYEQMAKCKARQKVLVLDVNRYNRTFGQERPGGEEMGPKLDALLKSPPAGVQVWSSCVAKQRSLASDEYPMGVFLDELQTILDHKDKELPNLIQRPDKPLPLERLVVRVNERMKQELGRRKLEQVSRLSGTEGDPGIAFNKDEPPAPNAVASLAGAPGDVAINKMLIESVLDQIGTPPVKVTHELALRYDALPPFPVAALQKYQGDKPNPASPLRKAVKNARAVLWAIYPGAEPKELSGEVSRLRGKIRVQLNVLKEGYRAPAGGNAEKQFKDRVETDERAVALIMSAIGDALEALQAEEVIKARDSESKRWKANYDFILARVQLEYAYLYEYQSMLGSMRKEFPPRDPALHGGWKLASQPALQGDSKGKKFARDARKLLDKIANEHAGSPWAVLAKREKLTNLGLQWQPAR